MPELYRDVAVSTAGSGGPLRVAFLLSQPGGAPGPAEVGYQIFDAARDLLLKEGPRCSLPAGGAHQPVAIGIPLPQQDGEYRVILSPLTMEGRWWYEQGGEFLEVNVRVRDGVPAALHWRVTTLRGLKFRLLARAALRALYYPGRALAGNAGLIRTMVRRDILSRYRGSFGGVFWTVLNPLLLMLTYFFVFGVVLQARFGNDPSRSSFVLYFLAGLLPWLAFSEGAGRAPYVIPEHANFVKKLVFPVEVLPVTPVASGLVTQAFALTVFLGYLLVARGALPVSALWLPVLLIPQVMFTLGLAWFLAALGVFVRDLSQIMSYLLTLWFFLTPICYPETSLPAASLPVLSRNPMFVIVRGFRDVLLEGRAPEFAAIAKLWLVAFVVLVLGYAWFHRLRKTFPDVL